MSYFVKNSNLSSIQDIVNSFKQVITQQNALITALQGGLATGDTNITGIDTRVTANESTLGNLSTITSNNGSAIGVLQSAYTTNRADITNNASAIGVLQSALATNASAVGVLQSAYTTNRADITNNASVIGALQSALATNASAVNTLQDAVTALNINVIGFDIRVNSFENAVVALQYKPPLPILHWDFENFLDKQYAIPLANPFGIVLSNGSAVVDQTGPDYYLEATLPVDLLSKGSKTLMFKFKSYPGLDTVTDFVISTYGQADPRFTTGFAVRIRRGEIVTSVSGLTTGSNFTKDIYIANHPIPGFPASIFDEFFHLTVVINHDTDVITSFINGVGNMSTAAINAASATAQEVAAGTYWGPPGTTTTPFFVNKFNGAGNGTGYYDDIKIFNSALTPVEVQYYYDQQSI
jgi:hypothetical protein